MSKVSEEVPTVVMNAEYEYLLESMGHEPLGVHLAAQFMPFLQELVAHCGDLHRGDMFVLRASLVRAEQRPDKE